MLIYSYGFFCRRDEVACIPGTGKTFRMLGRWGKNAGLWMADFREQKGIYILYGNHGASYVGLTRNKLGNRLKDHTWDEHCDEWDRFSWFGFCKVLGKTDENGFRKLADMAKVAIGKPSEVITDVEALLIRAMGLSNIRHMKFASKGAHEWEQVKKDEVEKYLDKVG